MKMWKKITLTSIVLGALSAGIYFNSKNISDLEKKGIEIHPVGMFDANKDGVKDYLVVVSNRDMLYNPGSDIKELAYFDGTKVKKVDEKYISHAISPSPIHGSSFTERRGFDGYPLPVVVNVLGKDSKGYTLLKIAQTTPDFPVTINNTISVR